jgi:molybdopterin converting factor small subunit
MASVRFTSNLQRHVACPVQDAAGDTVRAVLDRVFAGNPRLAGYILDEHARLRKHVVVYVNGAPVADRVTLADKVGRDDEVFVFQALSGG